MEACDNVAGSSVTKTTTPVNGATDPNSNVHISDEGEFSVANAGDRPRPSCSVQGGMYFFFA